MVINDDIYPVIYCRFLCLGVHQQPFESRNLEQVLRATASPRSNDMDRAATAQVEFSMSSPARNPTAPSPLANFSSSTNNQKKAFFPPSLDVQDGGAEGDQWNQGYALQYLASPRHHLPLRVYYCR